jgi:hypothetical protein
MKNKIAAAAAILLVGCGGGGGGPSVVEPVISTASFPVDATFSTLATTVNQFTVSGRDSAGNTLELSVSAMPGPDKAHQFISTVPRKTYTQTSVLRKNGVIASTSTQEVYFSTAPFAVWGIVADGRTVLRQDFQGTLPAAAKVGDVGALYSAIGIRTEDNYLEDPGTVHLGITNTATWSIEADTASTAWLCMHTSAKRPYSTSIIGEDDCFRIDATGSISGFKVDLSVSGTKIEFR